MSQVVAISNPKRCIASITKLAITVYKSEFDKQAGHDPLSCLPVEKNAFDEQIRHWQQTVGFQVTNAVKEERESSNIGQQNFNFCIFKFDR